ncbi:hypothetical protein BofuT4_P148990.1 [Botrytis cinerea T4]|uniref:Uncharacterized protein n=1 Tax=Botryotinia fuckeliana (strain T4) TaxID=999810 RepID=G2YX51_BOTF4|nr:hypothetical protein BofuT4_P148990.1 [Botrytis cinerea T4]
MSQITRRVGSGGPGKRRKSINEYSSNPHAVYERERKQNLPPDVRAAYKARENARVKVTYHINKLKKTQTYQNANEGDRKIMEERKKGEILDLMKIEKSPVEANQLITSGTNSFNPLIEIGSEADSQSEMSEEEDDEDIYDFDAISDNTSEDSLCKNRGEDFNEEVGFDEDLKKEKEEEDKGEEGEEDEESSDMEMDIDDFDEEEIRRLEREMGIEISDEWKQRVDNGIWGQPREVLAWVHNLPRWKSYWSEAYNRFEATIQTLTPCVSPSECDWVVYQGARYPKKLPHQLFDCSQRAVWRNLSVWAPEKLNHLMQRPSSNPLSLPGPDGWWAYLWKEHKYSAKRHGFWQPKQAMMQRSKDAWNLVFFPEENEDSEEYAELLYIFSKHDVKKPNDCFYL